MSRNKNKLIIIKRNTALTLAHARANNTQYHVHPNPSKAHLPPSALANKHTTTATPPPSS